MALNTFGTLFALLFASASARAHFDVKKNLQSGYAAAAARLQELAQQTLKDLAEDPDVPQVDADALEAKNSIPAEEDEWKAPSDPWIVDQPKIDHIDEIFYGFPGDDSHNLANPPQRATLAFPIDKCPPALGWDSLVTIPGRKNLRSTMQYVADLMAGKGRYVLNIDMKDTQRMKDINAGLSHMKANNMTYNLNTDGISLFGYSLGAITLATAMHKDYVASGLKAVVVTSGASYGNLKQKLGLNWEGGKQAPPSLIIHCTDDGLVPYFAKKTNIPPKYVEYMRKAGLVTHGLFYDNGCYHHPFKNLGFFNQIDLFLTDPINYEIEIYADPATYEAMMDNFVLTVDGKGCADNDEGIEPIKAFAVFNQEAVCKAACYQQTGCVAIDWYPAFAYERPDGESNCFLYTEPCMNPKYDICTKKTKCPKSYHMAQDRSVFSMNLAQFAPKTASIQRHGQNLRGSARATSQVMKVRTRSMCETVEGVVETTGEGQKGLFATLEAADSAGCEFVFTNFGEDCGDFKGEPSGITDALVCEDASARLEGYSFHGIVDEAKQDEYPAGCFLKANSGGVLFNPSTMPGVKSTDFALACNLCDSMMAPQDIELKHYVKTTGDSTDVSYCEGEYDLGIFDIRSNAECAEKCDSLESCVHFKLCTVPKGDCCQLSSTCKAPYKSASAEWSGFMKKAHLPGSAALANFNKSKGNTCPLKEYALAEFDITDAAGCAAKCEESNDCISFVVCTDTSVAGGCCKLSSVCTMPFTHEDPDNLYDAYMSWTALVKLKDTLSDFVMTPGSNAENSYCTGSYDLAEYHIYSPAECAAKCSARADCTHFKLCKGSEHMCCALSSTCSKPYTSASGEWDGYLNTKLSRFRLAADLTPISAETEPLEVEPLCSERAASIHLTPSKLEIPDEGKFKMLWKDVTTVGGEPVNLVIENVAEGDLLKGRMGHKGKGATGVINLGLGTEAELKFSFQDADEKCVELDEIHFTALDINHMFTGKMEEIWEFSDIAGHVLKANPEIIVDEIDDKLLLKATGTGWCGKNEVDPFDLKEVECSTLSGQKIAYNEERRAVMIVYKRTCEFRVKVKAPGDDADFAWGWPFIFTFNSELEELCS